MLRQLICHATHFFWTPLLTLRDVVVLLPLCWPGSGLPILNRTHAFACPQTAVDHEQFGIRLELVQ